MPWENNGAYDKKTYVDIKTSHNTTNGHMIILYTDKR